MKWEMLFNADENILFVKTKGILDLAAKTELIEECIAELKKQNCCRCLIDNSEIASIKIKFMEIYSIPDKLDRLNMPRNLCIAQVFLEKHIKDFHFLETVSHNRGYLVSVFSTVESALLWLKK